MTRGLVSYRRLALDRSVLGRSSFSGGLRSFDRGRITGGLVGTLIVLVIVISVLFYVFGTVVPPGHFGVRQVTVGPGQGFSDRGLQPGLHFAVPFYSTVHLVPRTVQVLDFHRTEGEEVDADGDGVADLDQIAGLEVRTSDGLSVDVDVTVLTRFFDEPSDSNGGPAELFTRVGTTPDDWDNQIRRVAADELRQALGALLARQFYEEPQGRADALSLAVSEMRKRLNPNGIRVESVLIRRYTYKDDRFDEAIFNKNIQEQEQRLKDAAGRQSKVKAQLEQVEAEWDAKVETLRVTGENAAQVIRSEATLYENEKKAEGDLAVAKAQAEVDRLKAGALAASPGAAIYVAREMAPLLSSLRGGVVADIDPYDIEEWSKRLGVESRRAVTAGRANSPAASPMSAPISAPITAPSGAASGPSSSSREIITAPEAP